MAGTPAKSPLAPAAFPDLPVVDGVSFATVAAGVRYTTGRTDVMLAKMIPGTAIAGVFTKSSTRADPVLDCQEKLGGAATAGAAALSVTITRGSAAKTSCHARGRTARLGGFG